MVCVCNNSLLSMSLSGPCHLWLFRSQSRLPILVFLWGWMSQPTRSFFVLKLSHNIHRSFCLPLNLSFRGKRMRTALRQGMGRPWIFTVPSCFLMIFQWYLIFGFGLLGLLQSGELMVFLCCLPKTRNSTCELRLFCVKLKLFSLCLSFESCLPFYYLFSSL